MACSQIKVTYPGVPIP
ncbi:hypothetical protein F383_34945 [Gossypium arboreum]|uniref:Uncharacterized protein n=1 Tax=Gossypium arboreum TaxID=29729 RepID=A0A0B0PTJ5_GOSAR|nr:hypothetical protein F383_28153 [Gossypium arboreum]KHG28305.1 hypothetical protein F383_34945 [Gossypium arboreum]